MELSLCMMVKNEEEHLPACLESVREAVDEMIILDTGSTDRTKEIALRYTPHVHDYCWEDDFAAARNASFALATKPYVLWLDADDVLDPPEREKLIALKDRLDGTIDAVMMPYHYAHDEAGRPSLVFDRERIVRREAGFAFSGAVHEAMAVSGRVIREEIAVRHTGSHGGRSNARNLRIYEKQIRQGKTLTARDWYYYARELKNAGEDEQAVKAFDRFLLLDGWIENRIDAYICRGECLIRLGRREEGKKSLLDALLLRAPCAHALCVLGKCAMDEGDLSSSAFWYGAALLCPGNGDKGAFVCPGEKGYVPLMQLSVIYDRMDKPYLASQMNEQALLLRPGDRAATENRAYFEQKLRKMREESALREQQKISREA